MIDCKTIAKKYLREKPNDPIAAAKLMATEAKGELRDHLVILGAQQVIRNYLTSGRNSSSNPVLPHEAARAVRARWMDEYRLFDGIVPLAKATDKDLADSARKHDAQAAGHNRTAAFERAVAERLVKTGKTVEQVFSDETLKKLKAEL